MNFICKYCLHQHFCECDALRLFDIEALFLILDEKSGLVNDRVLLKPVHDVCTFVGSGRTGQIIANSASFSLMAALQQCENRWVNVLYQIFQFSHKATF